MGNSMISSDFLGTLLKAELRLNLSLSTGAATFSLRVSTSGYNIGKSWLCRNIFFSLSLAFSLGREKDLPTISSTPDYEELWMPLVEVVLSFIKLLISL